MSLDAMGDVEVGLGGFSLETLVGIRAGMDTLHKTMKRIHEIEAAYQFGVLEIPIRAVQASAASGNLIIDLGGPSFERQWELKRLTIGGVLWTTSVTGTAVVCVGSVPNGPAATSAPLTDVVDQAGVLPDIAFYSTRQVTVRNPNHLFVVILTPAATTQYAVGGQVSEFPDKRMILETEN